MTRIHLLFLLLSFSFSAGFLNAETKEARINHYNMKKGVALQGYDPVAYFTQGDAQKGNAKISHNHKGITYYFTSASNLDSFKKNPSKYEPQYGGWCAYALAKGGGKVKIDPKRFKIIDQKLYLFFDTPVLGNTLKKWNKGQDQAQIAAADAEWAKLTN